VVDQGGAHLPQSSPWRNSATRKRSPRALSSALVFEIASCSSCDCTFTDAVRRCHEAGVALEVGVQARHRVLLLDPAQLIELGPELDADRAGPQTLDAVVGAELERRARTAVHGNERHASTDPLLHCNSVLLLVAPRAARAGRPRSPSRCARGSPPRCARARAAPSPVPPRFAQTLLELDARRVHLDGGVALGRRMRLDGTLSFPNDYPALSARLRIRDLAGSETAVQLPMVQVVPEYFGSTRVCRCGCASSSPSF